MDRVMYRSEVGVGVGEACVEENGPTKKVVILSFLVDDPPYPDDQENDENYSEIVIPVSGAKSLLIDLQDAIQSIVENKPFT